MATLRANIYNRCTTYSPLATLIGNRCYPIRLPDSVTLPAITYRQLSDDDYDYRAHGEGTDRTVGRVSFDCWGSSADESAEVADALIMAWTGYVLASDIGWSQIMLRLDEFEESLGRYRSVVDVQIEHARTTIGGD